MVSNIILCIVARKKVNIGNVLYVSSLNTKRQRYTKYKKISNVQENRTMSFKGGKIVYHAVR